MATTEPWRWWGLSSVPDDNADGPPGPDAGRGWLRRLFPTSEDPTTWGDVARALAGCDYPVPGARPPLGPSNEAELARMVDHWLPHIVHRELCIPLERVTWESRWYKDFRV